MGLEKTTVLSAVVGVAGLLAEIIFRNTFSKNAVGMIFSLILAVIVLIATYYTVDGVLTAVKEQQTALEDKHQEYYQMYCTYVDGISERIGIDASRAILEEIDVERIMASQKEQIEKILSEAVAGVGTGDVTSFDGIGREELQKAVEAINANTLSAAKAIAKYEMSMNSDIKKILEQTQK